MHSAVYSNSSDSLGTVWKFLGADSYVKKWGD